MIAKIIRRILIVSGLVIMAAEMYLSAIGAFKVNTAIYYAVPMAVIAVIAVAVEAIAMHYSVHFKRRKEVANSVIAVCVWGLFFVMGCFFTITGVNVRTEQNTATKVAGWIKFKASEDTENELKREIGLLTDQIAALNTATIQDGGTARKLRPVSAIEADGRFLKSDRCANINPANTGQRTVCQEYASARDLAQKESDLKAMRGKLDSARNTLTNTDVAVSKDAADASILTKMGIPADSAILLVSVFIGIALHLISALIWFIVPTLAALTTEMEPITAAHHQPFQVHVHTPPSPPAQLALPGSGRVYDPGRQRTLIEAFWSAAIAGLPAGRQRIDTFLPDFDRICAREGIETPSREVFCALSIERLPNHERLGGVDYFSKVTA